MTETSNAGRALLKQPLFERISRRDIAVFSRQLSLLLTAGMPLLKALRVMAQRTTNFKLSKVIDQVADSVEQGNTFANALSSFPKLFPPLFINIVRVGEVGGALEQALRRLALHAERELRYRSKLLYALMYPMVIVAIMVIVIAVILVYVFPVFLGLFEGKEDELPAMTRVLAAIGDFIGTWWAALILLIAGLIALFFWFRKTPFGRRVLDRVKLRFRLPVAGPLGQKVVVARVAETFSLLLKSGIQLLPALRVVGGTCGNMLVEEAFNKTADEVEQGRSMQEILAQHDVLPPIVVDMMGVGEEAGSLDEVLDRVAESYTEEVDMALEGLNRIIEPILLVLLGGVVLVIALAILLPYWNIDAVLTFE